MTTRYDDILDDLRASYDGGVAAREAMVKQQFKLDERAVFHDRLTVVQARSLIEVGAGTGEDSRYFQDAGLDVTAVDLSPAMVHKCQAKGLRAYVGDVLNLDFEAGSFDAAYAMNCLLHVPNADLDAVLRVIASWLPPGGLFFVGLWGGRDEEGIKQSDDQEPKRFFSWRSDKTILGYAARVFEILDFHTVTDEGGHFQALTLVRP